MGKEHEDTLGTFWWILLGFGFVLFMVFFWGWRGTRTTGRVAQTTAQLMSYRAAITNFNATAGHWPNSLTDLESNAMKIVFIAPPALKDPWGHRFIFVSFNSQTGFGRVINLGRDGRPGGIGVDGDIEQRFP